jgi:hypothetical protein
MSTEETNKEQQILRMVRKTLADVVKDVTPLGGRPNPLSNATVEEIKKCFALISERERELADELGYAQERPYYADDDAPVAKVISIVKPPKH